LISSKRSILSWNLPVKCSKWYFLGGVYILRIYIYIYICIFCFWKIVYICFYDNVFCPLRPQHFYLNASLNSQQIHTLHYTLYIYRLFEFIHVTIICFRIGIYKSHVWNDAKYGNVALCVEKSIGKL